RLDQAGAGLGRLQVGDPHPCDALDRGELGQKRLQEAYVAEVLAVGRGVLTDQEQLLHPLLCEPPRLLQDVAGASADEGAPEAGDRAERAAPVASAGQLQRRHRATVEAAAYGPGTGGRGDAGTEVGLTGRVRGGSRGVAGHTQLAGPALDG